MEKYCKSCGRVFDDLNFKLCPYCGSELATRYGRQPIPRQLRHEVFKRDGYRCRECGASKDETSLEIDHIVPVAKGGTNDIDNLQTLCRECNRMKHTDEWVGGETDLESVKQELDFLKNQIKKAQVKLNQSTTEDDRIEYEYQIMILEKKLPNVENKYNKLYEEHEQNEAKRKNEEKTKKMYKKLYVKLDDEAFLKWATDNYVYHRNKKKFIKSICNASEKVINDYIYTVQLYKDLMDDTERLNKYNELYNELDKESLELLKEYSSLNYNKGLLILECMNKYGDNKIKSIIYKEKKRKQHERDMEKRKIREQEEFEEKAKEFAIKENVVLEKYKRFESLSKAAEVAGYNAQEVCMWYFAGKNGDPLHYDFYLKVNRIRKPRTKLDMTNIPSEGQYCRNCHNVVPPNFITCPYCMNKL